MSKRRSLRRINFTKKALDALPLPTDGARDTYHDAKQPGLSLRASSSGVKTFSVLRRVAGGKPERITIGRYPEITPEQARKAAAAIIGQTAQGVSVAAGKRRKKLEGKTLAEVLDDYATARKTLKPATVADIHRTFVQVCPDWLDRPLTRITPAMVERRHREHGERSHAVANRAMRYLRALFNFAAARYSDEDGVPLIGSNSVGVLSKTKAWFRVERRKTVILPHQLKPWFKAVQGLANRDWGDAFTLILLTGLRREEALGLRWCDVDTQAQTLTVRNTKNHSDHTLPLSNYVAELLKRRAYWAKSDYVFADSSGRRINNSRYAQSAIEKASGVRFCIHDLRRTFATIGESLDVPAYTLKRLLNHADGNDVTAGYIVASVERLREPMQRITDYVLRAAGVIDNVAEIKTRGAA
jgi:integrase